MNGTGDQGVVVTGAAGGIGRALAVRLIGEGRRVVINDLDAERTAATAAAHSGVVSTAVRAALAR